MALTVIGKEYSYDDAGFLAMVADISAAYAWDEISDSDTSPVVFKKYLDEEHNKYVAILLYKTSSYGHYFGVQSYTGATTYTQKTVATANMQCKFCNIVYSDDFFCLHGCVGAFSYYTGCLYNIGIAKSTNVITGASGHAAWMINNATNNSFAGDRPCTIMDADSATSGSINYYAAVNGRLMITQKIATLASINIPDKPLRIDTTTEAHFNTVGYCTYNGKRYYKNGCILLPVE